ncbi:hypothetical protein SAMN04487761_13126 [Lachnospiraceae bacterium C7]|nr:hypothetical protein SAMN04487761_13126 [Lachnospiraceae bacterium C7]
MLTYDDALNMNYYKKTTFSGWMENMRFKITKDTSDDGEDIFHAWIWQGPYIFDLVPAEKKIEHTEPFTEDGRKATVDWINKEFDSHLDLYGKKVCR